MPLGVGDPAALACVRILNMENLACLGSAVGEEIALRRDGNPAALVEVIKDADRVAGLGIPQPGRTVQKHCEHISTIKTKDSRPTQGGISVESFELYLPEDTLEVINRSRSKGCKLAFPVDHVSVCRSILDHQML